MSTHDDSYNIGTATQVPSRLLEQANLSVDKVDIWSQTLYSTFAAWRESTRRRYTIGTTRQVGFIPTSRTSKFVRRESQHLVPNTVRYIRGTA
jgi:hypothetical protein